MVLYLYILFFMSLICDCCAYPLLDKEWSAGDALQIYIYAVFKLMVLAISFFYCNFKYTFTKNQRKNQIWRCIFYKINFSFKTCIYIMNLNLLNQFF